MQIFFGGKHIGGADDLAALKREGKLTAVLNKQKGSDSLPGALASASAEARSQVADFLSTCACSLCVSIMQECIIAVTLRLIDKLY